MSHWEPSPQLRALVLQAREIRTAMYEEAARNGRDVNAGRPYSPEHYQRLFLDWCRAELAAETRFKHEMRQEP